MSKTANAWSSPGTTLGNKANGGVIPAANRPIHPELSPGGFGFSFFLGAFDATYPNECHQTETGKAARLCETLNVTVDPP